MAGDIRSLSPRTRLAYGRNCRSRLERKVLVAEIGIDAKIAMLLDAVKKTVEARNLPRPGVVGVAWFQFLHCFLVIFGAADCLLCEFAEKSKCCMIPQPKLMSTESNTPISIE